VGIHYGIAGAGAGLAYYYLYEIGFAQHMKSEDRFETMVVGHGLFGSALISALVHPKLWWAGLYGGAFFGFAYWFLIYGNHWNNKGSKGFAIELPGLTEEEREKQQLKDYIQQLGERPHIKSKSLIDL
jgi:hypothetical protein